MLPLRTATLLPATHTNAFLIGEGEALLIEPGAGDDAVMAQVVRWVEESGVTVKAIAMTHHHGDHIAGASRMAEHFQAPLWAHAGTAALCPNLPIARTLAEGDVLAIGGHELHVLHTPGHASGHLCFESRQASVLIAGDMVAGVGTILIEPGDGDLNVYLAQLERLARLKARRLLPAHGGLVTDGPALLRGTADHRRMRDGKVADALAAQGPATADGLLPVVYGDVPKAVWPYARLSLLAHLHGMAARGEAREEAGIWSRLEGS